MRTILLTLRQLIDQGGFSDFQILAGSSGLQSREVKTICVIDTLDLEGWIFGGEFLLTSGYIFRDDPERLTRVIEMASKAGAAALGVKVGEHIDRIPPGAIRAADRLSFPLIGIPVHYAHTEIINPALVTIADNRAKLTDSEGEIRRQFFDVLLSGGSHKNILDLLHSHTHRDLLFIDSATGERYAVADSLSFGQVVENVPLASLLDHFTHETIELEEKVQGYLFLDRPVRDIKSEIALAQAKDALRLQTRWEREREKIERGREAQFLQDILYKRFRHESEIRSRGRALGWSFSGPQAVVVLDVDRNRSLQQEPPEPYIRAFEIFRSMLRSACDDVPSTLLDEGMSFILNTPLEKWPKIRKELASIFANARREARLKTGLQLAMGVGSPAQSVLSCDVSFREARRALAIAKLGEPSSTPSFWEELGIYKILAPMYESADSRSFIREQLGALLETGGATGASSLGGQDSLLGTLFCIIRHNWQLKPVANALNLHYNTVKYRYRRIGEILGTDLESSSTRTSLALAMELYVMGGPERRDFDGQ